MKQLINRIPVVGPIARSVYRMWIKLSAPFVGSEKYWIERYDSGGNSGQGSYGELAEFKAGVINEFVRAENVKTIIEFGCGDGNQLKLSKYPAYIGFDVSARAIALCKEIFSGDPAKTFKLMRDYEHEMGELALSLDVIYHLVEDDVFDVYMDRLFGSSERFVIVYSTNTDLNPDGQAPHIRHRQFTRWIEDTEPGWKLIKHIPNQYPFESKTNTGSAADFFIYRKEPGYEKGR